MNATPVRAWLKKFAFPFAGGTMNERVDPAGEAGIASVATEQWEPHVTRDHQAAKLPRRHEPASSAVEVFIGCRLTAREIDVVRLLALGRRNRESPRSSSSARPR